MDSFTFPMEKWESISGQKLFPSEKIEVFKQAEFKQRRNSIVKFYCFATLNVTLSLKYLKTH